MRAENQFSESTSAFPLFQMQFIALQWNKENKKAPWKVWAVGTVENPEIQHHEIAHGRSSWQQWTKILTQPSQMSAARQQSGRPTLARRFLLSWYRNSTFIKNIKSSSYLLVLGVTAVFSLNISLSFQDPREIDLISRLPQGDLKEKQLSTRDTTKQFLQTQGQNSLVLHPLCVNKFQMRAASHGKMTCFKQCLELCGFILYFCTFHREFSLTSKQNYHHLEIQSPSLASARAGHWAGQTKSL